MPDDYLSIKLKRMKRKQKAIDKLEATLQFLNCNECRSKFIIRYFGQQVQNAINVIFAVKKKMKTMNRLYYPFLKTLLILGIQEKLKIEEFLLIEILDKLLADEKILLNNSEKYFKK